MRRSPSHIVTEAKLSGNGYDTGLEASRLRYELSAQMGSRAIGPNQHVTGRCRSILEAGVNVALLIVLESNTLLLP